MSQDLTARERMSTDEGPLLVSIVPAVQRPGEDTLRPVLRVESLDGPNGGLRIGDRRTDVDAAWHRDPNGCGSDAGSC
jgi:hypothetical protein